jgi:hypothetical protein
MTTRDRIARSLVVLFAQPVIRVVRLTVDDITIDTDTVAIRLGSTAIVVPEPLAGELRGLGINILTATKWAETAGRPWGDYPTLRAR